MLQCYNRGCGQKYDPNGNTDDCCRHHPGAPFFHDAYKGWSCCKRKCTDFTEFLNIKGCTVSKHSNVKPPEPEKPKAEVIPDKEVVEIKPLVSPSIVRPPLDSPMSIINPEIAPSLKQQISPIELSCNKETTNDNDIPIGTPCSHGACQASYQGPDSNEEACVYHPGVPIFHEGLKFWSCCQRKTTDFSAFLSQAGCVTETHLWKKENDGQVQCRWDYHQTGSFVIVSIYAKEYSPSKSVIKLNPIRLNVSLVFPRQSDSVFNLDLELRGVVDVASSQATMYGTKVEIKLKKAEPGTWAKLEANKTVPATPKTQPVTDQKLTPTFEALDLSSI
ncbi:cysteine and histidine-rich domain-containing protein morgana [Cylas formicarius]|uniref:cysteine and histidine-rich domain-containing protein morgana n=1 Tax=Cylas formicarius TaxID=197179 RepID=UPI00295859AC|nr:cysteine and histidine-rich domain-containing protein morgana [Cylas formicarius]XP_060523810.1 cysteine and histidine-rich domain-containing protein morgana [Cylas formicarius]